jgi:hypothetical protein
MSLILGRFAWQFFGIKRDRAADMGCGRECPFEAETQL